MRLRSRGLGRKELVLDFREYEVVRAEGELVVVGSIRDPVNWDFTIRICEDDVPGMTQLVLRPAMIGLLLRALFKRGKRHHWGQDRTEHVAEGKQRRAAARANAVARARAAVQPQAERRSVAAAGRTLPERSQTAQPPPAAKRPAADAS